MPGTHHGKKGNGNNPSAHSPPRRRWVNSACFFGLGFCLRSAYDPWGSFQSGVFQQCNEYRSQSGTIEFSQTSNSNSLSSLELLNENSLEFVFTIGLEGTGHHLMDTVIKGSPAIHTIKEWNLTTSVGQAATALSHYKTLTGMFNMATKDEDVHNHKTNRKWEI